MLEETSRAWQYRLSRQCMLSLALARRVLLHVTVGAHDLEVAIIIFVDGAVGHHLPDQAVGGQSIGVMLLNVMELLLEHIVLLELGLNAQLLLLSCSLLVGDLLLGASPLAARLQHAGRLALASCRNDNSISQIIYMLTYC